MDEVGIEEVGEESIRDADGGRRSVGRGGLWGRILEQ